MTSPTPARLRCVAGSPRIPPLWQSAARAPAVGHQEISPLPSGRVGEGVGGAASAPVRSPSLATVLETELEDQFQAVDLIHLLADVPKAKNSRAGFAQTAQRRLPDRRRATRGPRLGRRV